LGRKKDIQNRNVRQTQLFDKIHTGWLEISKFLNALITVANTYKHVRGAEWTGKRSTVRGQQLFSSFFELLSQFFAILVNLTVREIWRFFRLC
jgi:hypothetical protein